MTILSLQFSAKTHRVHIFLANLSVMQVRHLQTRLIISSLGQKHICVFQVSRPYLGFCPDPKHFIVNCGQNIVKFAEK